MKLVLLPHKPLDGISITLVSHWLHISWGAHVLPLSIGSRASKSFPFKCLHVQTNYILVRADVLKCYGKTEVVPERK